MECVLEIHSLEIFSCFDKGMKGLATLKSKLFNFKEMALKLSRNHILILHAKIFKNIFVFKYVNFLNCEIKS